MATEKIKGELRTEFGKGAARRIRRADKVPAVIYGHGNAPTHVTLPGHDTQMALRHGGANALLEIDIDGEKQLALTKQVQVEPIHRVIEHIDFVTVTRGQKVHVDVPIHIVGDAVDDGVVMTEVQAVEIEAEATHIPEWIEIDVEGAEVGTQIHAGDLTLPEGSTLYTDPEDLIVHVALAKEEPLPEPGEEGEEAAEGEAEEAAEGEGEDAEGGDDE